MAWRNPHRQTISDLSAFPKHLLLSAALLELPHWLLVNYANKVMFVHIVFFSFFFCCFSATAQVCTAFRGATIKVTEHVSKIYASVTNCDALQLISPLLLPPHRFSVCLSVRPSDLSFEVFFKKKSLLFLSVFPLHVNVHICQDRRQLAKRGPPSRVWVITNPTEFILKFSEKKIPLRF